MASERYEILVDELPFVARDLSVQLSGGLVFAGQQGNNLDVTRGDGGQILLKITDQGLFLRIGSAIEASIETVRRRIDAFGTTEPTIQRQGRDRILVQVPGIKDVTRLKALVGETGKLEFRMVDTTSSLQQAQQSGRAPPGTELIQSEDEVVQVSFTGVIMVIPEGATVS